MGTVPRQPTSGTPGQVLATPDDRAAGQLLCTGSPVPL